MSRAKNAPAVPGALGTNPVPNPVEIITCSQGASPNCRLLLSLMFYFPNIDFNIILPIFRSSPTLEVGMPVSRAIFCFAWVMPNALFHENDRPGIPMFDFLLVIFLSVKINHRIIKTNDGTTQIFCAVPSKVLFLCQQMPNLTHPKYKRRTNDDYQPICQLQPLDVEELLQSR